MQAFVTTSRISDSARYLNGSGRIRVRFSGLDVSTSRSRGRGQLVRQQPFGL
jgi:hypothetical protein